MHDNFSELIRRCTKGDEKSQLALFRHVYGSLMGISRRYHRNSDDCKLHVNTAFLKILDKLSTFDAKGSFEAWCARIMNNVLIDEWRKNRRYENSHQFEEHLESRNDLDEVTFNTAESEMDEHELLDMILQLPQTTRHVFNLFAIEGFAHTEIAEMMNMSEGTSRWHVNEARNTLKKLVLKKMNIVPLKKVG